MNVKIAQFAQLLNRFDKNKLYMVVAQFTALGIGYVTQVILFRFILGELQFSRFQLSNFTTNFLGLFVGTIVPTLFSRHLARDTKESARSHMIAHFSTFVGMVFMQTLISATLFAVLLSSGKLIDTDFRILMISLAQVITFSFITFLHMYFIGIKDIKVFAAFYILYGLLKNASIIGAALMFGSAESVILSITFAGLLQTLIIMAYVKAVPRFSFDMKVFRHYMADFGDQLLANLALFGILNYSFIAAYFKITQNHENFNLVSLSQPVGLIPYFLVSSLGNLYLVDFSSGKAQRKSVGPIIFRLFILLLLLCLGCFVGATAFFYLLRPDIYLQMSKYLLFIFPSTIAISLLSILFSIYQGVGKLHKLRMVAFILVPIYILISVINLSVDQTILFSGISYLVLVVLITLLSPKLL